jgi:hypothetical protein
MKRENKALFEIKTKRGKYMILAENLMAAINMLEARLKHTITDADTSTEFINHKFMELE